MRFVHLVSLALIAWTHVGWGLVLRAARKLRFGRVSDDREQRPAATDPEYLPNVSIIVAAHREAEVIQATVAHLIDQSWPRERLQVIVACDGSPDNTAELARQAGADLVLELPHGGKHAAQAQAVKHATGEILAFSDANTIWERTALAELVAAFHDQQVGYACGRVTFTAGSREDSDDDLVVEDPHTRSDASAHGGETITSIAASAATSAKPAATNQEGVYWQLEMALRRLESDWWSVTAGNGAIYALRADLWPKLKTRYGHDLCLPTQVVRQGFVAVDRPTAKASEPMVPTIEGERARKRRMMAQAWRALLEGPDGQGAADGVLDPRGLPPQYLLSIFSHRWLRYFSPALHLVAFVAGLIVARRILKEQGSAFAAGQLNGRNLLSDGIQVGGFVSQLALLVAAAASVVIPWRPLRLARYYVSMTWTIAAGFYDHLVKGTPDSWTRPEGTR